MTLKAFLQLTLIFIASAVLFSDETVAQIVTSQRIERFIRHLVSDSDSLRYDIDPAGLQQSSRLGIKYEGVKNKFLISYGLTAQVLPSFLNGSFASEIDSLPDGFCRLNLAVPQLDFHRTYYFRNGNLVSPIAYFSRKWKRIDSKFFTFVVSDTVSTNTYCISVLDRFIERMVDFLGIDSVSNVLLKREKIFYYLCKNQDEIRSMTGFNTRGIYNLAYDCVVSTYPCHFHELLHLLMNYKLRMLPLYAHPFFQEGFAVALGGRGGLDPGVVLNAGIFLEKSGSLDFSELLSKDGFEKNDPSISYPVAGLYSKFLMERVGIGNYIRLYRDYSGTEDEVRTMRIDTSRLPPSTEWMEFIGTEDSCSPVGITVRKPFPSAVDNGRMGFMVSDSSRIYFWIKDTLLLTPVASPPIYCSDKFRELFPSREYTGQKYSIIADSSGISIYNLFTGNLIASYVKSFALPPRKVEREKGYFKFSAARSLFDEPPAYLSIH